MATSTYSTPIMSSAFSGCSNIKTCYVPDTVLDLKCFPFSPRSTDSSVDITLIITKDIEDPVAPITTGKYYSCVHIVAVEIASNVTSIGKNAFCQCTNLGSVTFEENSELTSIGDVAFSNCDSLQSIKIPKGVEKISDSTFYDCNNLEKVEFEEDSAVSSIDASAFFSCEKITNIILPETVTSIGETAFEQCGFTSITIPANVTTIGKQAFRKCKSLETVTYLGTPDSIADDAFEGCEKLTD